MWESSRPSLKRDEQGVRDAPAGSAGEIALGLGILAIVLSVALGLLYYSSVRRLDAEVAQLSRQTQDLNTQVARSQQQSQTLAQQAAQAAANAQAAAQQRDLAQQAQSNSEAQAQLAQQQAAAAQQQSAAAQQQSAAAQQRADEAAVEYRRQREADLQRLQEALGKIAETKRTANGVVMTLDSKSIRFDFDDAHIKPEYRDVLNRIAGVLLTLRGYTIAIYGYTDDVGSQAYNLQLSQRRAEAVRDFLVQAGISSKMSTKGFGKSDPRVAGNSEQARAANRRVEIAIIDTRLITNGPLIAPQ